MKYLKLTADVSAVSVVRWDLLLKVAVGPYYRSILGMTQYEKETATIRQRICRTLCMTETPSSSLRAVRAPRRHSPPGVENSVDS